MKGIVANIDVKQFSSDKILGHLDRIDGWIKNGISKPITFELDMTNYCNHKCPTCCGFYDKENKDKLSYKDAEKIIFQIRKIGGKAITFTGGGEPLCNKITLKAVKYACYLGLDVGFITNGTFIDTEVSRVLLRHCTWIRVSLDASSPEFFNYTHGMDKDTYDRVLDGIKILVKDKKELGLTTTIGIGYLTSLDRVKEIYSFALLCKELGVDYTQFRPLLSFDNQNQDEVIKEIERSLTLSEGNFQVLYSKHKYDSMNDITRPYDKCYGHHFATVISANKKVYICCHMRGIEKYCIGDLSKNTLKEIWNSEERKKVYESIDLKECIPLCRCNTFNTVLWNIKQEKIHGNFL